MNADEKWYSIKEVGAFLEVSHDAVRDWIIEGELQAFVLPTRGNHRKRIYRSRRISRTELLRFIKAHSTELKPSKRSRVA